VGTQRGRERVYARADLPVISLTEENLQVVRDDKQFNRHTSITGWPQSPDRNEQKEKRKLLCVQLSQDPAVKLVLPQSPIIRSDGMQGNEPVA